MFTGIINHVGRVVARELRGDLHLVVDVGVLAEGVALGASVALNGVCLTVVHQDMGCLHFYVSAETQARTTAGRWQPGMALNVERSLRVGDEIGGHFVYGHVDAIAKVASVVPEGDSHRLDIRIPGGFERMIAPKGSIALDGVSLTVNEVSGGIFSVNIIPHTMQATSFGDVCPESSMNMEIDVMMRYLARLRGV